MAAVAGCGFVAVCFGDCATVLQRSVRRWKYFRGCRGGGCFGVVLVLKIAVEVEARRPSPRFEARAFERLLLAFTSKGSSELMPCDSSQQFTYDLAAMK
jgi:hypothetical protein